MSDTSYHYVVWFESVPESDHKNGMEMYEEYLIRPDAKSKPSISRNRG